MKNIDFSCKHNIMMLNEDGTYTPMDEPYFRAKKIAPGTWQVLSDGDYTYVIEGDNEALVIDSGYGCGNIREFCQTLTDKPISKIANTHDHFDHTANNCYFDCAYMSEETKKLATIPFPSFSGIDFPRDYPIEVIGEGYIFHLGGRDIETFSIPDHAVGSLAFLDRKERILFSGDEIGSNGARLNGSVERYLGYLEKLEAHRHEFDTLCAGSFIGDASVIEKYIENCKYILAGHEGEFVSAPGPMEWPAPTPDGKKVYKRRDARPEDVPKFVVGAEEIFRKTRRVMEYAGCRVQYDVNKVRE